MGYLQAGQMNPLHSFVMHQQEITRGPSPQVAPSVRVTAAEGVKTKNPSFVGRMLQVNSEMAKQNHVSAYGLSVPCSN